MYEWTSLNAHTCAHSHTHADPLSACSFTNIWQSLSPDLVQTEETQKDRAVDSLQKYFEGFCMSQYNTVFADFAPVALCCIKSR